MRRTSTRARITLRECTAAMKKARAALAAITALGALMVLPGTSQATIYSRFDVTSSGSFPDTICGINVQHGYVETDRGSIRTGTGSLAGAFFQSDHVSYVDTLTAANGKFITIKGDFLLKDIKATPLGGGIFKFVTNQAGQPFVLYDSRGNLVLRDRGLISETYIFNSGGDNVPGGTVLQVLRDRIAGPHPGFSDATLCPAVVPLLT